MKSIWAVSLCVYQCVIIVRFVYHDIILHDEVCWRIPLFSGTTHFKKHSLLNTYKRDIGAIAELVQLYSRVKNWSFLTTGSCFPWPIAICVFFPCIIRLVVHPFIICFFPVSSEWWPIHYLWKHVVNFPSVFHMFDADCLKSLYVFVFFFFEVHGAQLCTR